MVQVVAVGTDIIEIERVKQVFDRFGDRFLNRVLSEPEKEKASRLTNPLAFIAGRFAAKEAVYKCIAAQEGEAINWTDITVSSDEVSGAPIVTLSGGAKKIMDAAKISHIMVTISHSRDYAVAFALAQG